MRRISVFCGSSSGKNPSIRQMTEELGRLIARRDLTLVYGGASIGLMGILANATLASRGRVIGVIPKAIERREIVHRGLTELHVVQTMQERKIMMMESADAIIGLPGGLGTMDGFFEVITWAQLGLHKKPIGLLNTCGYFDSLISFFDRAQKDGFIWPEHRFWHVEDEPEKLLDSLSTYVPPSVDKWIQREQV